VFTERYGLISYIKQITVNLQKGKFVEGTDFQSKCRTLSKKKVRTQNLFPPLNSHIQNTSIICAKLTDSS